MRVAIHQPNFLPWSGYFHKISQVEKFVFLDDVQLERGKSYTQRSKILIGNEAKWITVPIVNKSETTLIRDARVDESVVWKRKMLKTIELNYKKTPGFEAVFPILQGIMNSTSGFLVDYNIPLIYGISDYLGLETEFSLASELHIPLSVHGKDKIIGINKALNADTYLSGRGAGSIRYIEQSDYIDAGIKLEWQEYTAKEYPQGKNTPFIPGLSILDLIFNCGKEAREYL